LEGIQDSRRIILASVFTNDGEDWAVQRMAGQGDFAGSYADWIAWGTGLGVVNKSDVELFDEDLDAIRVQGVVTAEGSGASAKYQLVGTLTVVNGPKTITNAGSLTHDRGAGPISNPDGLLIVHGDFSPITIDTDDQVTFTITIDPS
jgi:hypothetical protein